MATKNNFSNKTVNELQQFLKERGVSISNKRKALCKKKADLLDLDTDREVIKDDRSETLTRKLTTDDGVLLKISISVRDNK